MSERYYLYIKQGSIIFQSERCSRIIKWHSEKWIVCLSLTTDVSSKEQSFKVLGMKKNQEIKTSI